MLATKMATVRMRISSWFFIMRGRNMRITSVAAENVASITPIAVADSPTLCP